MKVAILGADGQLGTALQEALGTRAIAFSHTDLDVTWTDNLIAQTILEECSPNWIINCAAAHRVDELEGCPNKALSVNALGAYNVAWAARNIDAGVVYISTDYVFGRGGPRWEGDVRHPFNVYGVSKVAGENFTMAICPTWLIIRTSTLFGGASSFVETMLRLGRERDSIEVVSDLRVSPTYATDLATKIVEILAGGHDHSIVHITNKGFCTHKECAEEIFRQAGLSVAVRPCASANRDIAKRPYGAVLKHGALERWGMDDMRSWQDALSEYLMEASNA